MLDASSPAAVSSPSEIADDPPTAETWRDEVVLAAVAAIGENALVVTAARFDVRAAVVDWIVAIAGPSTANGDHAQVTANEYLNVA